FLGRIAALAANHVVVSDFSQSDASKRALLTGVSHTDTDEEAIRAQLADLHSRIYGQDDAPHSPEVDETYALFASTLARNPNVTLAWKTTLTAMLEDFRLAYY